MSQDAQPGERAGQAKKYSVSMPEDIASEVRELVGKGSFSAYVTSAVQRQLERDRLAELVHDHEQRLGPIDDDLVEAAASETAEAERRYATWLAAQEQRRAG
ncbi:Arc/MetJ-type ribon-helix-helix transcriptional regulator [Streptacidiphilus sp. MAP12-20]|uniref:hypothetical protein n=1 Tax=Streptacidiphilus sp. MAP12-20 TaxID=3156299 RepID=UPI003516961D